MMATLTTQQIETPLGPMLAAALPASLCLLAFNDTPWGEVQLARTCRRMAVIMQPGSSPLLEQLAAELGQYFAGQRRAFSIPLAPPGTAFQQRAWQALQSIPYGQTSSYGQLAAQIGAPRAARAVGAANGQNPIAILIPCHRLIGATGSLVDYGGGLWRKQFLLALENQKPA